MTKHKLKYLFTTYYKDGSVFQQPENDKSATDPALSSYHDVRQKDLKAFALYDCGGNFYMLDLGNGEYTTNAGKFKLHTGNVRNIQLAYFRRVNSTVQLDDNSVTVDAVGYHLGYQGVDDDGQSVYHYIVIQ